MGLNEKILNKSNSYNFYKSEYEKFSNKEKQLKKIIKDLEKQLKKTEIENNNLKKDISFLRHELIKKEKL